MCCVSSRAEQVENVRDLWTGMLRCEGKATRGRGPGTGKHGAKGEDDWAEPQAICKASRATRLIVQDHGCAVSVALLGIGVSLAFGGVSAWML
jgi:hypothetical protein